MIFSFTKENIFLLPYPHGDFQPRFRSSVSYRVQGFRFLPASIQAFPAPSLDQFFFLFFLSFFLYFFLSFFLTDSRCLWTALILGIPRSSLNGSSGLTLVSINSSIPTGDSLSCACTPRVYASKTNMLFTIFAADRNYVAR